MKLRLLVLAISDRCDQRCRHCSIWLGPARPGLSLVERLALAEEAIGMGVEAVLLTGGEPLLSADLWPVAERLEAAGVRLYLTTNGMLLERYAEDVGRLFDEVYVSLDGASPVTHDAIRGVTSWPRLAAGVAALRVSGPHVRIVARCTLHAGNLHEAGQVAARARTLGFDAVSFLPLDAASGAFGGRADRRRALVPSLAQVDEFEGGVDSLAAPDGFVLESAAKLRRLARHLRASAGGGDFERPECDAPWWSSVVDADGAVRPCFFHAPVGQAGQGLRALRASKEYAAALGRIAGPNPTCARCVCPKKRERTLTERIFG